MNSDTRKLLTKKAILIGDEIAARAIPSDQGTSWKTKAMGNGYMQWAASPSIYMGVSGIVLFFVELYKVTKVDAYLKLAQSGAKWIVNYYENQQEIELQSFFTGNLGAIYVLLAVSKASDDPYFAKKAKNLLHRAKRYEKAEDDLLNGTCGVIIGLLLLHSFIEDKLILDEIDYYLNKVLSNSYLTKKGIHWDRSVRLITGLCGFSHGAAGIGFTFLQVANYFKNPAYNFISDETFRYENAHYDKNISNWPDFRKLNHNQETEKRFREGYLDEDHKYFTQTADFSAWCHGASGIALSRLLAIQTSSNKQYKVDLDRAVQKAYQNQYTSYTLCHGFGGDIILFLSLYKTTNDQHYFEKAKQIMLDGVLLQEKIQKYTDGCNFPDHEEDISLFNGLAGVGYCMLSLLDPSNVFDVLSPNIKHSRLGSRLNKINHKNILITVTEMKEKILKTFFSETIDAMKPKLDFYKKSPLNLTVINHFKKLKTTNILRDIEVAKLALEGTVKSWALFGFEHQVARENLESLSSEPTGINNALLKLSKYVKLHKATGKSKSEPLTYVLYLDGSTCRGQHVEISEFEYDVLRLFKKQALPKDVYQKLERIYSSEIDTSNTLQEIFKDCLRNALSNGFLFTAS